MDTEGSRRCPLKSKNSQETTSTPGTAPVNPGRPEGDRESESDIERFHSLLIWGFPKIAVPLNHPFLDGVFGFSLKSTIYFGVPPWRAGNLHIPWIKMPWCHHGGHLQASRRRLQTALQPAEGLLRRPGDDTKYGDFMGQNPDTSELVSSGAYRESNIVTSDGM